MDRKLYSYLRWSSAVQSDGSTRERQSSGAQQYAAENNYELVEILDDGVSAFRGVNAQRGALAAFIRAVEDGFIPSDSLLYVESLDRISRDKILKALGLFNDLLELGITIITGSDKKTYTEQSVNENSMDLLQSVLLFSRAHEESKTKQLRTNGSAIALIERFRSGLPVTIKSVGSHPWWIDASTDKHEQVRQHPIFWPVAQLAMNHFLEGESVFKVTGLLNERYPRLYKGKAWQYANVRKLRINTAVYGQRVLTVAGNEYKLEGYYPALITEGQYLRLQQIRETIKYLGDVGTGEKNNINLLAGLKIFRCGHCGSTMMAMLHRDSIRYMCGDGRRGNYDCRVWSMPGLLVEHTLMLVTTIAYIDLQRKGRAEGIDYTTQIESAEKLIADIGERINRATTLVINGLGNIEEVQKQMLELNEQRKHLVSDLEVLQRKRILSKDDTFESLMMNFFTFAQYGVLQDPMHDYRNKLRDIVRTSIGDVRTWKVDRRLYISFQIKGYEDYFNFSAGTTRYDWGCYLGELPFSSENISDEVVKEDIAHEQMVQFVEKRAAFERASMDMLREAQNLLSTVHYPELDGKMFWPRK